MTVNDHPQEGILVIRPSFAIQFTRIIVGLLFTLLLISTISDYINPPEFQSYQFTLLQIIVITVILLGIIFLITSALFCDKLVIYTTGIEYVCLGYRIFAEWDEIKNIRKYGRYEENEEIILENSIINSSKLYERYLRYINLHHRIIMVEFGRDWRITTWGKFICDKANLKYWRTE
jgi:hypothetical protein